MIKYIPEIWCTLIWIPSHLIPFNHTDVCRKLCFITYVKLNNCLKQIFLSCTGNPYLRALENVIEYQVSRCLPWAHAPGMPGSLSPPPQVSDPDMHHGTCVTHVPWCMPGSLTSSFLWSRRWGETFRHFRRMRNPQFYVSVKRPMIPWNSDAKIVQSPGDCILTWHIPSIMNLYRCLPGNDIGVGYLRRISTRHFWPDIVHLQITTMSNTIILRIQYHYVNLIVNLKRHFVRVLKLYIIYTNNITIVMINVVINHHMITAFAILSLLD